MKLHYAGITSYETLPGRNSEQIERRTSNIDGFVKSPKTANFQVAHLIISIGYEIEIQEFWLFTRLSTLNVEYWWRYALTILKQTNCKILNRSLRRAIRSWAQNWKTQGRTTPFGKLRAWACRKQPNRISKGCFAQFFFKLIEFIIRCWTFNVRCSSDSSSIKQTAFQASGRVETWISGRFFPITFTDNAHG